MRNVVSDMLKGNCSVSVALWLVPAAVLLASSVQVRAETLGRLRIGGTAPERLVLVDERGEVVTFNQPGEHVSLPAGRYFLQGLILKGDFECYGSWGDPRDMLEVTPDHTPVLQVGLPLRSHVEVERTGRLLSLEYSLVDGQGRRYVQRRDRDIPPTFTVTKNGRTLGTGLFAYG